MSKDKNYIKIEFARIEEIEKALKKIEEINKMPDLPYVTGEFLSKRTGISKRALSNNAKRGAFPKYKMSRTDVYNINEVRKFIENNKVEYFNDEE